MRSWLTDIGCPEPWEMAPQFAEHGVTVADLDKLRTLLSADETCVCLQFFARYLRAHRSVETLAHSDVYKRQVLDCVGLKAGDSKRVHDALG